MRGDGEFEGFVETVVITMGAIAVMISTAVMAMLAVLLFMKVVRAHDGMNDAWFESLTVPGHEEAHCCGGRDCKAAEAELRGGEWWAQDPAGHWVKIPPERVISNKGNPVGSAVLCALPDGEGGYFPICFVPGALF